MSFPAISTGVYGYPVVRGRVRGGGRRSGAWLDAHPDGIDHVTFVLFSGDALDVFEGGPGAAPRIVNGAGEVLDRRTLNRTLLARQLLLERVDRDPRPPWSSTSSASRRRSRPIRTSRCGTGSRASTRRSLADGDIVARRALAHGPVARDAAPRHRRRRTPPLPGAPRRARAVLPATRRSRRRWPAPTSTRSSSGRSRRARSRAPSPSTYLGKRLAEQFPDLDAQAMAYTAQFLLPLVQVPPRGLWGRTGRPTNTTAEAWLGGELGQSVDEKFVLRYLRAFGPASAADIRTWSWLTGLRPVIERLRPHLRSYRDEWGPRAARCRGRGDRRPRPAGAGPLPPSVRRRLLLSHAGRSRLNGGMSWGVDFAWKGVVLVDGFISAAWRVRRERRSATMSVEIGAPARRAATCSQSRREAERLFAFVAADAETREVRFVVVE